MAIGGGSRLPSFCYRSRESFILGNKELTTQTMLTFPPPPPPLIGDDDGTIENLGDSREEPGICLVRQHDWFH